MRFAARIGQFLFFLGVLAGMIYYLTERAGAPRYAFFLSGLVLLPLGVYLMWTYRNESEESDRFHTLRRIQSRQNKKDKRKEKG